MRFDVVVGNPPYNKDIYLKFVMKGFELSSNYTLMITPAKWQARQYRDTNFVSKIRDNIKKVVYYIDSDDVFNIRCWGGISYYLIDNTNRSDNVSVVTKCRRNSNLNSSCNSADLNYGLHSYAYPIIQKVLTDIDTEGRFKCSVDSLNTFGVLLPNVYSTTSGRLSDDGAYFVLSPLVVKVMSNIGEANDSCIYSSDSVSECDNIVSYFSTRFIRFLMHLSLCKQHPIASTKDNFDTFLFVPMMDYACIYEDKPLDGYTPNADGEYLDNQGNKHCSLYIKYKLTADEINIIESVIRGR